MSKNRYQNLPQNWQISTDIWGEASQMISLPTFSFLNIPYKYYIHQINKYKMQTHKSFITLENTTIQNWMFAVPRRTWSRKSFWGSRRSSGCSACGSLIGPGWAAGPSDAPQTVSLPADPESWSYFPPDVRSTSTRLPESRWLGGTHDELAPVEEAQLIIPSALLGGQLQDFGLKGLFSGSSLVFYHVDLGIWNNMSRIISVAAVPSLFS